MKRNFFRLSLSALLLTFLLLFVTGCQSDSPQQADTPAVDQNDAPSEVNVLDQLPETREFLFSLEGQEEKKVLHKAQHDEYYAMYYDLDGFEYVPGEVLPAGFSDQFVSVYDDETSMVLTTMKVCYTADTTPEQWMDTTLGTEWSPQNEITSSTMAQWEPTDESAALGQAGESFQVWQADAKGVTNLCYTTSYKSGCLAVILSYPDEVAEGWGSRMHTMVESLVLVDEA